MSSKNYLGWVAMGLTTLSFQKKLVHRQSDVEKKGEEQEKQKGRTPVNGKRILRC